MSSLDNLAKRLEEALKLFLRQAWIHTLFIRTTGLEGSDLSETKERAKPRSREVDASRFDAKRNSPAETACTDRTGPARLPRKHLLRESTEIFPFPRGGIEEVSGGGRESDAKRTELTLFEMGSEWGLDGRESEIYPSWFTRKSSRSQAYPSEEEVQERTIASSPGTRPCLSSARCSIQISLVSARSTALYSVLFKKGSAGLTS